MVITVKPIFQSVIADDPAAVSAGLVTPGRWNDGHEIEMATARILGRVTASAGDAEELTAAQVKTLLAIALTDITDASANGRSLVSAADYAAMRVLLGLVKGTSAGNIPFLDGSGLLDTNVLPAIAITDTFEVASQAAMLALTAEKGDIAIRTDLNKTFALATNSPSTLADWKELRTPTDTVLAVAGLTGTITASALKTALAIAVADITDASANGRSLISAANYAAMKVLLAVAIADVTGLQSALDAKSAIDRTINNQTGTTYTFVLADNGKYCRFSNAAAQTVTVPPNSSVAFPVGAQIDVLQAGAGKVTFAQGSGVTISSKSSNKSLSAQWSGGMLLKTATDAWDLIGDLTA